MYKSILVQQNIYAKKVKLFFNKNKNINKIKGLCRFKFIYNKNKILFFSLLVLFKTRE
jgi:hypothetical protein